MKNILLLVISLYLFSCTGYEDGPKISFRKPERKLCNGKWIINKAFKNGTVVSNKFAYAIEFQSHYNSNLGESSGIVLHSLNYNSNGWGSWAFYSSDVDGTQIDTRRIIVGLKILNSDSIDINNYPLISNKKLDFRILRLTMDELNLEYKESLNSTYRMEFKQY